MPWRRKSRPFSEKTTGKNNGRVDLVNDKFPDTGTRQERREKKLKKKRERMPKHGENLARIYMEAILKRLKGQKRVDK